MTEISYTLERMGYDFFPSDAAAFPGSFLLGDEEVDDLLGELGGDDTGLGELRTLPCALRDLK